MRRRLASMPPRMIGTSLYASRQRWLETIAAAAGGLAAPAPADVARGVGIVAAQFALGGVAFDHRIHVARRDAPEQPGPAQPLERLGAVPVGLRNDADA